MSRCHPCLPKTIRRHYGGLTLACLTVLLPLTACHWAKSSPPYSLRISGESEMTLNDRDIYFDYWRNSRKGLVDFRPTFFEALPPKGSIDTIQISADGSTIADFLYSVLRSSYYRGIKRWELDIDGRRVGAFPLVHPDSGCGGSIATIEAARENTDLIYTGFEVPLRELAELLRERNGKPVCFYLVFRH